MPLMNGRQHFGSHIEMSVWTMPIASAPICTRGESVSGARRAGSNSTHELLEEFPAQRETVSKAHKDAEQPRLTSEVQRVGPSCRVVASEGGGEGSLACPS